MSHLKKSVSWINCMQLCRVCVDECFMSKLETTGATGAQNLVDQGLMATAEDLAQSQRLQLVMPLCWDYLSVRHCDQTTDFFTLSRCGYCICAGRIQSSHLGVSCIIEKLFSRFLCWRAMQLSTCGQNTISDFSHFSAFLFSTHNNPLFSCCCCWCQVN